MIIKHCSDEYVPSFIKIKDSNYTLLMVSEDEEYSPSYHNSISSLHYQMREGEGEGWSFHAAYFCGRLINLTELISIEWEEKL